jgi:hypothetical protein
MAWKDVLTPPFPALQLYTLSLTPWHSTKKKTLQYVIYEQPLTYQRLRASNFKWVLICPFLK